jgi:hypothetical protein
MIPGEEESLEDGRGLEVVGLEEDVGVGGFDLTDGLVLDGLERIEGLVKDLDDDDDDFLVLRVDVDVVDVVAVVAVVAVAVAVGVVV